MGESTLNEGPASSDTRGMGRRAAGERGWRGVGAGGVDPFLDADGLRSSWEYGGVERRHLSVCDGDQTVTVGHDDPIRARRVPDDARMGLP